MVEVIPVKYIHITVVSAVWQILEVMTFDSLALNIAPV